MIDDLRSFVGGTYDILLCATVSICRLGGSVTERRYGAT